MKSKVGVWAWVRGWSPPIKLITGYEWDYTTIIYFTLVPRAIIIISAATTVVFINLRPYITILIRYISVRISLPSPQAKVAYQIWELD